MPYLPRTPRMSTKCREDSFSHGAEMSVALVALGVGVGPVLEVFAQKQVGRSRQQQGAALSLIPIVFHAPGTR